MLPYADLLAPTSGNTSSARDSAEATPTEVRDYTSEFVLRAKSVFSICKSYSEEQRIKRNARINVDRKFRDIKEGDRIYIKVNIRRNKFIQKFDGPYRVVAIRGKIVYCYSLNNKRFKCVQSEKCRFAGDLFQDDDPTVNLAFPEYPPVDEKELMDESESAALSSSHDAKHEKGISQAQPSCVQSKAQATKVQRSKSNDGLLNTSNKGCSQNKSLKLSRGQVVNHRYSLRNRA